MLALVAAIAGCNSDRLRPGPPSLVLEGPSGATTFSPDTLGIVVRASDPNGLDSVTVGYQGQVVTFSTFAETEINDFAILFVPEGLSAGEFVSIVGIAVDLAGNETRTTLDLTVIPRP